VLVVTRLLFNDGIQLNGLPAPRADSSQASICPFTSQDSRFTVSHSTVLNELIFASSSQVEGTFRFCAVARALTLHLCRCCESAQWAEFPHAQERESRPPASPTQNKKENKASNKNFGSFNETLCGRLQLPLRFQQDNSSLSKRSRRRLP